MANRAYLITGETEIFDINEVNHDEDIIAAANYSIPLLWLALFDEKDFFLTEMQLIDGSTVYCPRMAAKMEKSKDLFTERRSALLALLPDDLTDLFEIFAKFILCIDKPYIHMEISEIWTMASDIPQFENDLRRALRSMNNIDLKMYRNTLKDICVIDFDFADGKNKINTPKIYDEITALLCGYSWFKKLPWN